MSWVARDPGKERLRRQRGWALAAGLAEKSPTPSRDKLWDRKRELQRGLGEVKGGPQQLYPPLFPDDSLNSTLLIPKVWSFRDPPPVLFGKLWQDTPLTVPKAPLGAGSPA